MGWKLGWYSWKKTDEIVRSHVNDRNMMLKISAASRKVDQERSFYRPSDLAAMFHDMVVKLTGGK